MELNEFSTIILALSSFGTSFISAISGEAGGVLLFSIMTIFLSLDYVVPIHGLVQLTSNSSRILFLRKSLLPKFLFPFALGSLLGVMLATWSKKIFPIPNTYPLALIVFLIFYVLFKPKKMPTLALPAKYFGLLGFLTGILGIYIGTIGPFVGAFFVRDDLSKEEIISNKAFMQAFVHLLKIPAFLALGFNFLAAWPLILVLIISTIFGSQFGVRMLTKINQKLFMKLLKIFLFISALRILYQILFE